jgi:hypothetical protein
MHDLFYRSRLRPFHAANDDALFPYRDAHSFYDFGTPESDRDTRQPTSRARKPSCPLYLLPTRAPSNGHPARQSSVPLRRSACRSNTPRVVTKLSLEVVSNRGFLRYNEAMFGSLDTVTPESVAPPPGVDRCACRRSGTLAGVGSSSLRRDGARRAPDGTHAEELGQARKRPHARINNDPKCVLKNVHTDSPGNYDPAVERLADRAPRAVHKPSNLPQVLPRQAHHPLRSRSTLTTSMMWTSGSNAVTRPWKAMMSVWG